MDDQPLRVGVAGLGTVGVGVLQILAHQSALISARAGRPIHVTAISARDRHRDRGVVLDGLDWCDDPVDLARLDSVDVVVELIGGSDGPALALARAALSAGKHFVTANKALMAYHGTELAVLAEQEAAALRYEAAVAGGIPIIKALREGLAGNQITQVSGILNGTCNFILTEMERRGDAFSGVLAEAQALGYAEADPSFDIDGHDTAHKAIILAMLAYGITLDPADVPVEGIRAIDSVDIDYAAELDFCIKVLGIARQTEGGVQVAVYPAMVPRGNALAMISGPTNAVMVTGDSVGETVYVGAGAGRGPTASAVVGDLIDIARGSGGFVLGTPASGAVAAPLMPETKRRGSYYVRLRVEDELGVMAEIAQKLSDSGVSIDSLLQRGQASEGGVYVVIVTHEVAEEAVMRACTALGALPAVQEQPTLLRIEA